MRCNKCGAELLPNDTFCGSCGAKVVTHSDNDTASKPFIVTYEDEETPYSDSFKQPNSQNAFSPGGKTSSDATRLSQTAKSGKSKTSGLIVVLVIVVLLLIAFTVFNFLLMTDKIDTFKYDMFEGYRESMAEFLHLPYEPERTEKTDSPETQPKTTEPTTAPISSTQPVTQQTTVPTSSAPTTTAPTTIANDPHNNIPAELQKYANGLAYEGKTYRITLQEDDWYINYRSSPHLIDKDKADNNILGKMKHGSEIYVEYIYNGTWAVFYKDGRYVFSSLYASNNPSLNRLMEVV